MMVNQELLGGGTELQLLLPQPKKAFSVFELLTICGDLIKVIDDCTDWFLLYIEEKDPAQKRLFDAVYQSKCQKCRETAERAYEQLSK